MLSALRLLAELVSNLVLFVAVLGALRALWRGPDLTGARLLVVDGMLLALNLKVVATLLRTLEVQTWPQIGLFAALFLLRTGLKRVAAWERAELRADPA
ncbi:putative membrane protein [Deinococcus sp. HSC-46F16]|uniref:DUF1622 domain-containing protein n=1 Tax=Deinococcus sp. HSC-46F16 TaxID=2910968 RepID=UPI00209CC477|nr:DUF1622 domain-containing protein [Deinococcus sp. HSC-46F16]MCP2013467.1 putative membrane protein [Deinococcus sp. HSC-46F16]